MLNTKNILLIALLAGLSAIGGRGDQVEFSIGKVTLATEPAVLRPHWVENSPGKIRWLMAWSRIVGAAPKPPISEYTQFVETFGVGYQIGSDYRKLERDGRTLADFKTIVPR